VDAAFRVVPRCAKQCEASDCISWSHIRSGAVRERNAGNRCPGMDLDAFALKAAPANTSL
jgi:hypothetical protein